MRETKKVKDYADEIHKILLEDHQTDIEVGAISHIIDIVARRIIEGLQSYKYIRLHPFYFYYKLNDLKKYLKSQEARREILQRLEETRESLEE